ncbi:MAG: helix-turn-helix transcriptional regulator [Anaerostipes sp.]|nr:helix-turn-helix transcriptional regulator [Anaerostipes sp.]
MSFLNIGNNISQLRKEKKITQQELAEFAGVTKASVSKWETGSTTPDIQILPILAAFFDVSIDELIGYEAQLSSKQIRYYYHKLAQEFSEKDFDQVMEESKELVKKYYGCYSFLMQIAILWLNHASLAKSDYEKSEVLKETEKICTRIIEGSETGSLCENATAIRCIVWLQQGRGEVIIESMEKEVLDVNRIGDKGIFLPMAYLSLGNFFMAEKSSQIGMYRNLMELMNHSMYLLISTKGEETYCKEILYRMDKLIEVFQLDFLQTNLVAGYEYQAALKLCELFESKKISCSQEEIEEFENEIYIRIEGYVTMVEKLFKDGIKIHSDAFFYQLENWFEDLDLGSQGVRDGNVIQQDVIASLNHPAFTALHHQERLDRCIRRAKEVIKEKRV